MQIIFKSNKDNIFNFHCKWNVFKMITIDKEAISHFICILDYYIHRWLLRMPIENHKRIFLQYEISFLACITVMKIERWIDKMRCHISKLMRKKDKRPFKTSFPCMYHNVTLRKTTQFERNNRIRKRILILFPCYINIWVYWIISLTQNVSNFIWKLFTFIDVFLILIQI